MLEWLSAFFSVKLSCTNPAEIAALIEASLSFLISAKVALQSV